MKSQITAEQKEHEKEFSASLIVQILWVELMQKGAEEESCNFIYCLCRENFNVSFDAGALFAI